LGFSTVQRASLHNFSILQYLGVYSECDLIVRKAAEIIPEVIGVSSIPARTKDIYEKEMSSGIDINKRIKELHKELNHPWCLPPTKCAHCGSVLQQSTNRGGDTLIALICPNPKCPIKKLKSICKFVSKEGMSIYGVSESIIEKLLDSGFIKNSCDLYNVTKQQLLTLENIRDRSADKFLSAVYKSRNNYLHQLLIGLGIPGLGKESSMAIAEYVQNLHKFKSITIKELLSIDKVGDDLANNIIDFIKENESVIQWFIDNDIGVNAKKSKISSNKLNGKVFIMSGTASGVLEREEFKRLVIENNGSLLTSISKNLDFFVQGDDCGPSKMSKVEQINTAIPGKIKIITPKEFLKMIE
jgi:DNA ligase (NAD+)